MDPKNGRRIVRALEVLEQGAETHGAALPDAPVLWHPHTRILGVQVERSELVERLDRRVEAMWAAGLVDEVRALRAEGLEDGVTAQRDDGYAQALAEDPHLLAGLNVYDGRVTYEAVARDLGLPYTPAEQALGLC